MNMKDENLFKRFLQIHGMNTMYAGMYNQYKYEDNPETVQEFLAQVPRNLAIAYAFDVTQISPENPHGAKFWNDLDQQWRTFINKSDVRKSFEVPEMERQERAVKREEKAQRQESLMANNWSGLDLLNVDVNNVRKVAMPDENEVRINNNKKNVCVLNANLVQILDNAGFDTMAVNVDRNTNRMVLVFGTNLKFNVSKYSTDVKCINSKSFIESLEKYLEIKFNPEMHYYIKIAQRVWNNTHTQFAIVLSQRFTAKER